MTSFPCAQCSFVNPSKFYHVSDNGAWSSPRMIWSMPQYTSPPDPSPKVGDFVYSDMLQNAREYGIYLLHNRSSNLRSKMRGGRKIWCVVVDSFLSVTVTHSPTQFTWFAYIFLRFCGFEDIFCGFAVLRNFFAVLRF